MFNELKKTIKKIILRNTLYVVAIPAIGFILLNLTFILDYFFQTALDFFVNLFTQTEINRVWRWYPPFKHFLFIALLILISRSIFNSKIKTIYKATFFVVPLATLYTTIGMFMYRWPFISFSLAIYLFTGTFYYLVKKRLSWLYYYSLILISITLLIFNLMGGEI